jgi:hypothetical protein
MKPRRVDAHWKVSLSSAMSEKEGKVRCEVKRDLEKTSAHIETPKNPCRNERQKEKIASLNRFEARRGRKTTHECRSHQVAQQALTRLSGRGVGVVDVGEGHVGYDAERSEEVMKERKKRGGRRMNRGREGEEKSWHTGEIDGVDSDLSSRSRE